ncbi:MAG: glycosyl hydrolase family 28 protein [Schleiferilactobacillus harbinensis]
MSEKNQLHVYPIPAGAVQQKDYLLRVRSAGGEWKTLSAYQVKVDMHDVREASMVYFDFAGTVELEITFPKFYTVYDVQVRPASAGVRNTFAAKKVILVIDQPGNFSVEINKDRFHNLYVFAGAIEETPARDASGVLHNTIGNSANDQIAAQPVNRLVYVDPGVHYIGSYIWEIPSDTRVYLAPGAVLMGGLAIRQARNVHIFGRGVVYQGHLDPHYYTDGLTIDQATDVSIAGTCFIDPLHYTIAMGGSDGITIDNVKTFSCLVWSDGFDMMSCSHVTIRRSFLRTSDDCIAIYGSRFTNYGGSHDVTVTDCVLWADVAHPMNMGTHGDAVHDGDVIENIRFENIDVLDQHEFQSNYLGVMALNPGDKNTIRNVMFKNIRIDALEHGRVFDVEVKYNKDYNPAPGRLIENITFEYIHITSGPGEEVSLVAGYDSTHPVRDILFKDIYRDGGKVADLSAANIHVGDYTSQIRIV